MNSRERILTVLRGGTPDRIPWAPLIDGYYISGLGKETNPVDAIRDFGGDVFARHIPTFKMSGTDLAPTKLGASKEEEYKATDNTFTKILGKKGDIEVITKMNGGRLSQIIRTPKGKLNNEFVYTDISPYIPFPTEHRIKTVEDLKAYKYFIENVEYEPSYDDFLKEDAYIGDDGIATASGPESPFQTLLEIEVGIGNFYYLLEDYKSEVEELLEVMHERNKEIYKIIVASPAEVIIGYENTSTTTASPLMHVLYSEQQINDYARIVHKADKMYLNHMCGKLAGLEKELGRGDMDGIIDIAPPPTGNVTLPEARRMWGDKIIMGGIDATAFKGLNPKEISQYVRDILENLMPGGRVLLCSGDATPQGVPFENMLAITETVEKYGIYR